MEPAAECEECDALEDRYRVALRAYIEAMNPLGPVPHGDEFGRAYESAERIRLDFEAVRKDYQTHLRGHDGSSPR
jgi:hypothetical protein